MKKNILLFAVMLLHQFVFAQNKYKEMYYQKSAEKFTKEITDYVSDITPEQKIQLLQINKTVSMQFDSLKSEKLATADYKQKARLIFINREEIIKKILNENQFDEFKMQQDEKREAFKKKKLAEKDSIKMVEKIDKELKQKGIEVKEIKPKKLEVKEIKPQEIEVKKIKPQEITPEEIKITK